MLLKIFKCETESVIAIIGYDTFVYWKQSPASQDTREYVRPEQENVFMNS